MTEPLQAASASRPALSLFERTLAACTMFYGGVVFCLPVPYSDDVEALYPWWGKRIAIGNAQLYELFFLAWLILYGRRFIPRAFLNGGVPMRQAALWLIALALWCGLVSLLAPLPLLDLGRTARLMLNAALLLAVVRWTLRTDEFPLTMLVAGFLGGSIINLILSYQYPLIVLGTMRLSGQNTPGVAMGVAVHLCAWLFFGSSRYSVRLFSVLATLVFAFGCAISYSRIGWFTGGLGLLAWLYVLLVARPRERVIRRRLLKVRVVLIPVLIVAAVAIVSSAPGQEGLMWMQTLADQKFSGRSSEGDANRWAYALGTAEILSRNPFGVGYSGFFDAMTVTDTYRNGNAAEEDSPESANPHASFLWYATAGGLPGGLMAIAVFAMLLNCLRVGLGRAMGSTGTVLFWLSALSFVVIGMTVTYVLNSFILIVPAAVAIGWGWNQRLRSLAQAPVHSAALDFPNA